MLEILVDKPRYTGKDGDDKNVSEIRENFDEDVPLAPFLGHELQSNDDYCGSHTNSQRQWLCSFNVLQHFHHLRGEIVTHARFSQD